MKIVFVCKYNRFRSKLAESYFNKIMRKTRHKAKSAGLILHTPPDSKIREFFQKHGLPISSKVRGLNMKLLGWSDVIIIVTNDIPARIFDFPMKLGKKVVVWNIKDAERDDDAHREIILKQIKRKVDALARSLGSSHKI